MTLIEYIEKMGYTKEEWQKTADELCTNGVGKGCYQDYNLLTLVMGYLYDYDNKLLKGEDENGKSK